jgi:hypothetical protein
MVSVTRVFRSAALAVFPSRAQDPNFRPEPPRVFRWLQLLRRLEHPEQDGEHAFAWNARPRSAPGSGLQGPAWVALAGGPVDRLRAADPGRLGRQGQDGQLQAGRSHPPAAPDAAAKLSTTPRMNG